MRKHAKLLEQARRVPHGVRFADFETLLRRCGWTFDHQSGSHRIWYSAEGDRISIQEARDGKAKGYQVREFLALCEKEEADEGE